MMVCEKSGRLYLFFTVFLYSKDINGNLGGTAEVTGFCPLHKCKVTEVFFICSFIVAN